MAATFLAIRGYRGKVYMHSSRMRTARLLTVSRSIQGSGVCPRGAWLVVSAQGGVCPGGCLPRGMSAYGMFIQMLCIKACNGVDPPVNRIRCRSRNRCGNIILPQTSFAGSKNQEQKNVMTNYFIICPYIIIIKDGTTIDHMWCTT